MKNIALVSIVLCLFLSPLLAKAQTKRALVIGLGNQKDSSWHKINGDKDVEYVLDMLNTANYGQILTIVNESATKSGILTAFKTLELSCKKDDIIYIHYSGHGQQSRDINNDESDSLDECWIPYDAYRKASEQYNGESHLVDAEVYMLLSNISNKIGAGGKMLVVIDACHSGDSTRGAKETIRGVSDILEIRRDINQLSESTPNREIHFNSEKWITLTACKSDQINFEMKTPIAGKLTYALYTKVKNKEFCSNLEFFAKLKMFVNLNTGSRPQTPTMYGATEKYLITDFLR